MKYISTRLETLTRYIKLRRRYLLAFVIAMVIIMSSSTTGIRRIIPSPIKSVSEYEEYTYESILNNFRKGTVINPHPFKYIYQPTNICSTKADRVFPEMVILVKSDVTNFSYRMGIRSTWGNFSINSIKIVFLLGYSSTIQTIVDEENERFHDIVQENFIDAYKNNTLKTIMAFKWAVLACPGTEYLLFVDDDYFVNVNAITKYLKENATSTYFIAGHKVEKARVFRYIESDWYMTKSQYPFLHYPPYLNGGAMVFTMAAAMAVNNIFPYVRSISIDDVYVGIVSYMLNLSMTHEDRFYISFVKENLDHCLAAHGFGSPDDLIHEWKKFLARHEDNIGNIYRHQMKDILNLK